jgi:hypothetical protein
MSARVRVALFLSIVSLPAPAFALCPNCLGQTGSLTPTLRLVGAFMLIPFILAYVAARLIRRACRRLPGRDE